VLATGAEISKASSRRSRGKIYDANGPGAVAFVEEAGGEAVDLGIIRDDPRAIGKVFGRALRTSQLVVVSGGTSVGAKDFVPEALNSLGRPGSSSTGGHAPRLSGGAWRRARCARSDAPWLAGCSASQCRGVCPAGDSKIAGHPSRFCRGGARACPGRAADSRGSGMRTYARVVLRAIRRPACRAAAYFGSGILSSLVHGTGIVVVPPEKEGLRKASRWRSDCCAP